MSILQYNRPIIGGTDWYFKVYGGYAHVCIYSIYRVILFLILMSLWIKASAK